MQSRARVCVCKKLVLSVVERLNQALVHRGVHFPLRGLRNLGIWCYVNATLQALMACPALYHFLIGLSDLAGRSPTSTPVLDAL